MSTDGLYALSESYAPDLYKASRSALQASNNVTEYTGKNGELDMTDFLYLMVQQFQNQTIDNTADTADMMNQLVQMSVMQAVSKVTEAVDVLTVANTMSYAASLVGKEVTLGKLTEDGELEEIVGKVTGTGTYDGQQVIFVNGESHYLSEIMAVGRLPDVPEVPGEGSGEDSSGGGSDGGNSGNDPSGEGKTSSV